MYEMCLWHNITEVIFIFRRIRKLRENSHLTQKEMANYLNINRTTYSEYEHGKNSFSIYDFMEMAVLFETSLDYLVGFTNERKPYKRR